LKDLLSLLHMAGCACVLVLVLVLVHVRSLVLRGVVWGNMLCCTRVQLDRSWAMLCCAKRPAEHQAALSMCSEHSTAWRAATQLCCTLSEAYSSMCNWSLRLLACFCCPACTADPFSCSSGRHRVNLCCVDLCCLRSMQECGEMQPQCVQAV
jgi:hypothetical protein